MFEATGNYDWVWYIDIVLAVGAALACLAGATLGAPTLRLRGDYLAIVTLGFGEIIQDVLKNLDAVTKGTQGLNPVAAPALLVIASLTPGSWLVFVGLELLGLRFILGKKFGAWLSKHLPKSDDT